MLALGYKASAEQFGPRRLLSYALEAEAHGFDSVAVSDHFQPFRHTGGHAPAALPWLGALAVQSERIRFGTSVSTPTLRVHPSIMAQSFATIACLAPGRVWLGVGTGESMNEVPALGIDWPRFAERLERLAEAVELMRLLWTRGAGHLRRHATTAPPTPPSTTSPTGPLPILIAAAGAKAARFAGAEGDGYITTSGKPLELYTETLLPALEQGARDGRPRPGRRAAARGEGLATSATPPAPPRSAASGAPWRCRPRASRASTTRSSWSAWPSRSTCTPSRASSSPATPTSSATGSRRTSTWASATSCSTAPRPTSRGSWSCSRPTRCRACASASATA